jgi:5-methylcytosine-specific restriction endonuclease McrA
VDKRRRARIDKRKALGAWSLAVRGRDGACVVCGAGEHLQAHHILPKESYPLLSLDSANGVTLCPRHHKFGKESAHKNAVWWAEWLRTNRPAQWTWAVANMSA